MLATSKNGRPLPLLKRVQTLKNIFQDDLGGLEIQKTDGTWISARPIPGTIVVNIGDLMHFWSGGRYRATPHRVRVTAEAAARSARSSIAVFVHPNNETDIR